MSLYNSSIRNLATWERDDGDFSILSLNAMSLFDIEVNFLNFETLQAQIGLAAGFATPEQVFAEFLDFARLLPGIPLKIEQGESLPVYNFVQTPLAPPATHTFTADYFFYGFKSKPAISLVQTFVAFPPSLQAHLVIGAKLVYRRLPRIIQEEKPLWADRYEFGKFYIDVPQEEYWGKGSVVRALWDYTSYGYPQRASGINIRCLYDLFGGYTYTAPPPYHLLFAHWYSDDGDYIYSSDFENKIWHPATDFATNVPGYSYEYVELYGYRQDIYKQGWTVDNPNYYTYVQPIVDDPKITHTTCIPVLLALGFSTSKIWTQKQRSVLSNKLDGTWYIGEGTL